MAKVDDLWKTRERVLLPGTPGPSLSLVKGCAHGLGVSHGSHSHVHRRLLTSSLQHLRCLEPAAEIRRDRPLPDESARTTGSLEFVCPTRGKVSGAALSPGDLYVGRGTADFVWASSIWATLSVFLRLVPQREP